MSKFSYLILIISFSLCGCYQVETSNTYNRQFTWARPNSKPIYLSFKDTKNTSFYFLLARDTGQKDYKLTVCWYNPKKSDPLFNGFSTTLKFLVNNSQILTFKPIKRPRIFAYNLNSLSYEEEGIFSLSAEEFYEIAYAKSVSVELTGRYTTVVGVFNRHNTFKAFREFAEKSH